LLPVYRSWQVVPVGGQLYLPRPLPGIFVFKKGPGDMRLPYAAYLDLALAVPLSDCRHDDPL